MNRTMTCSAAFECDGREQRLRARVAVFIDAQCRRTDGHSFPAVPSTRHDMFPLSSSILVHRRPAPRSGSLNSSLHFHHLGRTTAARSASCQCSGWFGTVVRAHMQYFPPGHPSSPQQLTQPRTRISASNATASSSLASNSSSLPNICRSQPAIMR